VVTLAFFVLTQYRLVTDRRTYTLLSQRPALAKRRAGKNRVMVVARLSFLINAAKTYLRVLVN